MIPARRWLSIVCVVVPCGVAPLRVVAAQEPTTEATEPTEPVGESPSSTDAIHDAMIKAFTEHFQQGKVKYSRGAYSAAADEFEQAFAAFPAEAALRNVAVSHERAGDDVAAAIAARRYLALPPCDGPDVDMPLCGSHRDELAASLASLMRRVVELQLDVAPGVTLRQIRINGRVTPREDFPLLVGPGRVDVELEGTAPGQQRQRVIEVRAGETQTISVTSFDEPIKVPGERNPPSGGAPRQRGKWLRPAFWTGVALTSASLVAMGTLGGLTLAEGRKYRRAVQEFNDNKPPDDAPDADLYPHAEERKFNRLQSATNVMIGVAAGLAMLTLVVGAVAFTRPRNAGTFRASTRAKWLFFGTGVAVHY